MYWYSLFVFFFNDTATAEIYTYGHTLSLHDALPIFLGIEGGTGHQDVVAEFLSEALVGACGRCGEGGEVGLRQRWVLEARELVAVLVEGDHGGDHRVVGGRELDVGGLDRVDRKSTRLNSSH